MPVMPRTVFTALVAACAVLVPSQLAHAQDIPLPKPPKMALFKAKVSGSQVTSWNLLIEDDPFDRCDSSQTGHGSQDVRFKMRKPELVALIGGELQGHLPTATKVTREGTYEAGYENATEDCGPGVGHGTDDLGGLIPDPPDCGTRRGLGYLTIAFADDAPYGQVPEVVRPDDLVVWADLTRVVDFADCPWWIGGPVDGPNPYETLGAGAAVKRSVLRNPKRKVIKLSGEYGRPYKGHGFTAHTLVKWKLTLRRVTKVRAPS